MMGLGKYCANLDCLHFDFLVFVMVFESMIVTTVSWLRNILSASIQLSLGLYMYVWWRCFDRRPAALMDHLDCQGERSWSVGVNFQDVTFIIKVVQWSISFCCEQLQVRAAFCLLMKTVNSDCHDELAEFAFCAVVQS